MGGAREPPVRAALIIQEELLLPIGHMDLWNAITWVPANEIDHTVTLHRVITSGN